MCSVFFFFKRWLGCVMLLRKLLFFLPLFFVLSSRTTVQLLVSLRLLSLFLSLSRASIAANLCFFFSMRFVPTRRRNRNMHVCTLTHLLSNYTFFFFHGSELNCFCIYSFLHALTFFFFETRTHGFANLLFFFLCPLRSLLTTSLEICLPLFSSVGFILCQREAAHIYIPFPFLSFSAKKRGQKKKKRSLFFIFFFRFYLSHKACQQDVSFRKVNNDTHKN